VGRQTGIVAMMGTVLVAGSLALTPGLAAVQNALGHASALPDTRVSLRMIGSIGSFTPVTRDQRLATAYVRASQGTDLASQGHDFKFTPTSGTISGERSLTIVVRASRESVLAARRAANGLSITPMAYNLGVTKGLARFAGEGALDESEPKPMLESKLKLPAETFTLAERPKRFSANIQLAPRQQMAAAPTAAGPATLGSEKTYSVDLSSSYSLTRNLDVKAGVRYRGPGNRLVPMTDQAQDSQAVYVGTSFKF
jgi:hypothetical protein